MAARRRGSPGSHPSSRCPRSQTGSRQVRATLPDHYVGVQVRAAPTSHPSTAQKSPVAWFLARMDQHLRDDPGTQFFLSCDDPATERRIARCGPERDDARGQRAVTTPSPVSRLQWPTCIFSAVLNPPHRAVPVELRRARVDPGREGAGAREQRPPLRAGFPYPSPRTGSQGVHPSAERAVRAQPAPRRRRPCRHSVPSGAGIGCAHVGADCRARDGRGAGEAGPP